MEKTFKTKTGFCHILPDKIVLTRDGVIGNVANLTVGKTILRVLLLYGFVAALLIYLAYHSYSKGQSAQAVFSGLMAAYLVYGILSSLNNSATPVIERDKIKHITFKKAIPGLTRSRFEILFEDTNGKLKKRLIMLTGSLSGGPNDTEDALKIMRDEKLIV